MKEKKRKVEVLIHAKVVDSKAYDQIKIMSKSPAFKGLISIMPDVHAGMGAVIGFTGKFNNCVIPNVVGVDIGCGVSSYPLGNIDIDFEELDKFIRRKVPMGFSSQPNEKYLKDLEPKLKAQALKISDRLYNEFYKDKYKQFTQPISQLGTLGGGNHFIEIDVDNEGRKYLTIHSGSRNLGQKVATYYQNMAKGFHRKLPENRAVRDLEWLPNEFGGEDYLKALYLTQEYASINRDVMITRILKFFDLRFKESEKIESVHNYICPRDKVVRKGAISAHAGERVIIPLNMRDGVVIGIGKGNNSYNNSAPHGAGRVFGRNVMKKQLQDGIITMNGFKNEMKDVYSTSVGASTIDESPYAYKAFEDIEEHLKETVEIEKIMKPIYNLKSS